MGKLQDADFKTEAELTGAGAAASDLLNDTKIYVTANALNKTLDDVIADGDITGSPAGADGQVQYNNATAFGGNANFIFDDVNIRLGVGEATPSTTIHAKSADNELLTLESTDQTVAIVLQDVQTNHNYLTKTGSNGDFSFRIGTSNIAANEKFKVLSDGTVAAPIQAVIGDDAMFAGSDTLDVIETSANTTTLRVINEQLIDGTNSALIVRGKRAGGAVRQAQIGIQTHAALTEVVGYMILPQEDGTNTYYWTDNSDNFRTSNTATHIGTTSGTVVGTQTSDLKLKENIQPLESALDRLMNLNPVSFEFKDTKEKRVGFIAQEARDVVPTAVYDGGDKLVMYHMDMIAFLTKAVQELKLEVDQLKEERKQWTKNG